MSTHWNDSQPIYWQLKDRTIAMILDGTLEEGEALPSVRTVAAEFQLNPITVSKSYQALVDEGLVEKRRGLGMFVCEGARKQLLSSERARFLEEEWPATINRIEQLGLDPQKLLDPLKKKES
ncbi:MAG: GntR family transcriptional regulator [Xanthomonadales bacterium]|nr:GntR family transcriptional regulator [Gammaproteobacteria bacterium]MBT8049976.1 GntR family transcriptional regulator [Gammaproteobacteria bacterium]MBT8057231.1 GntR family transcriptional regulator [Gammaproteobacteria bacterium]NNJ79692.1 GntR family transcriptional regulator [Xanthomonadales bacterium]NNL05012.1 GntR family transcriptional regulator [Xanthomonadales bacterium]